MILRALTTVGGWISQSAAAIASAGTPRPHIATTETIPRLSALGTLQQRPTSVATQTLVKGPGAILLIQT